jgi:hypothetical protein
VFQGILGAAWKAVRDLQEEAEAQESYREKIVDKVVPAQCVVERGEHSGPLHTITISGPRGRILNLDLCEGHTKVFFPNGKFTVGLMDFDAFDHKYCNCRHCMAGGINGGVRR